MIEWGKDGEPKPGQKMTDEQFAIWKENNERFWADTIFWDRIFFVSVCFLAWLSSALTFHWILKVFGL